MDRRGFLHSALVLPTWGLSKPKNLEESSLLTRLQYYHQQWEQRTESTRSSLVVADHQMEAGILYALSSGLAAISICRAVGQEPIRMQAHPATQGLLQELSLAVGSAIQVLRDIYEDCTAFSPEQRMIVLPVYQRLTADIQRWDSSQEDRDLVRGSALRLQQELETGGLDPVLHKQFRQLQRLSRLSAQIAAHTGQTGLLESADPQHHAHVREAQEEWGEATLAPRPWTVGAVLGAIALGLLVAGGCFLVILGSIATTQCPCAGIPILLLGLALAIGCGYMLRVVVVRHSVVP